MSPLFVGSGRAVIAAILAAAALFVTRQKPPRGKQWLQVAAVAAGVVAGFPLLTSFALTAVPANHGTVVVTLLPALTSVVAALRGGERPPRLFWFAAAAGALVAVFFVLLQGGDFGAFQLPDLLLFGAVILCAIGYAEGGLLSRVLGSWQTISWALVCAAPVMLLLTGVAVSQQRPTGDVASWGAFAYLAVVSMFLGFLAWYRGLAIGPMTQVSQVQLTQPVMSICWAVLILHESIAWPTVIGGLALVGSALLTVRARNYGR